MTGLWARRNVASLVAWLLLGLAQVQAHEVSVFSSSALMEVDWTTDDVDTLHLTEINEVEDTISILLLNTMKKESESSEGLLPGQQVLTTDLHVKNVTKNGDRFHLEAIVDVLYMSETAIGDLAAILIRLSRKENVEEILLSDLFHIVGGGFGESSMSVNYKMLDPPGTMLWQIGEHTHGKEGTDKSLILACTLLCAALVLVTAVLLYVAGGWRDLREKMEEQMDWFKSNRPTYSGDSGDNAEEDGVDVADSQSYMDDSADEIATNPSGIIGAAPSHESHGNALEGLGVNHTPERGLEEDGYATTPFSEISNYTDANRVPLGIQSMRKMHRNNNSDRDDVQKMMPLPPY